MPLYLKSIEIFKLCRSLASYTSENKEEPSYDKQSALRDYYADYLISDAVMLTSNVAAAANTNVYRLRLKRSQLIKKVVANILENCDRLERSKLKEVAFLNMLRKETKLFRKQFIEWMNKSTQVSPGK
ncbi:hypothetical protein GWK08_18395 [Leptobacterium flavescens]|uniref:Four helix bundle protein n=1 Tax=Leptobacterium flavescens TaxID=472055 RepID=A0A6P0USD1_9FLAO|nr:hypothetical protein [Leptobacterium flavescens]NER15430.1 hypothetical protein [Leptobacterium flavescens]